jgi:hypothetical protein
MMKARLGFELYTALSYQNGRITLRETISFMGQPSLNLEIERA